MQIIESQKINNFIVYRIFNININFFEFHYFQEKIVLISFFFFFLVFKNLKIVFTCELNFFKVIIVLIKSYSSLIA